MSRGTTRCLILKVLIGMLGFEKLGYNYKGFADLVGLDRFG